MAKSSTRKNVQTSAIVTDIHGRLLSSLPKSQRRKAKQQVVDQLSKPDWELAKQDPEVLRRQAHVAANSRRRNKPTRSSDKGRAIAESC